MGERPTLWTAAFVRLSVAELAYFAVAGMMLPLVPLYATGQLGAGEAGVGISVGAFNLTALVLRPFAGRAADRHSRRSLMVWGALAFAALVALSPAVHHLALLVLLRVLLGVAEAVFFVASFALLADLAPPERAGEALSYNSLSLYAGVALGPVLGETVQRHGGFTAAFLTAGALGLVAAVLSAQLTEPSSPDGGPASTGHLIHRTVLGPAVGLAVGVAAMSGLFAFAALRARDVGLDGSRWVMLLFGAIVVGVRLLFADLPDRVPPLRLMTQALATTAVGMGVLALSEGKTGLFVGAAVAAFGTSLLTPAFFAAVMPRVDPSQRGAASGTASLFIDLGLGGGPLLLGLLASSTSITAGFAVFAVLSATAALWVAALGRRQVVSG
jgi:predicted MFS family arabinose efflux permease